MAIRQATKKASRRITKRRLLDARKLRQARWSVPTSEFEAHKGKQRSVDHAEAVAETEQLRRQYLSQWSPMATPEIDVKAVIRALQTKKVPFVLTGAHALGRYTGRPR